MKHIAGMFSLLLLGMVVAGTTVWGALALYYSDFAGERTRIAIALAFGLCGLATLGFLAAWPRWRGRAVAGFFVVFAALIVWWSRIEPANDRAWQPEVAVLPYAQHVFMSRPVVLIEWEAVLRGVRPAFEHSALACPFAYPSPHSPYPHPKPGRGHPNTPPSVTRTTKSPNPTEVHRRLYLSATARLVRAQFTPVGGPDINTPH